jgi:hypothetical protein
VPEDEYETSEDGVQALVMREVVFIITKVRSVLLLSHSRYEPAYRALFCLQCHFTSN